jgi:hypothetical protein
MKDQLISAAHTFIAAFITTFAVAIANVPADHFFTLQTWTVAFISGLALAAVRAGIKAVSPLNA